MGWLDLPPRSQIEMTPTSGCAGIGYTCRVVHPHCMRVAHRRLELRECAFCNSLYRSQLETGQ